MSIQTSMQFRSHILYDKKSHTKIYNILIINILQAEENKLYTNKRETHTHTAQHK